METSATSVEQRLALEHGVSSVLAAADAPATAAAPLIESVCSALGWQCGAWWLVEPGAQALVWVGAWGVRTDGVAAFLELTRTTPPQRQPGGLVRRAWLEGEAIWLEDVTREATFRRAGAALAAGLHSALAFPVRLGEEVIGVMEFFSGSIRQPDAALLDSMRYIGAQIGQFCQRSSTQQRLRDSEERYQSTIELAAVGISHIDQAGRFIHANNRLCSMLGYTREELLRLTVKDVSHPDDRNVTDEVRAKLRAGLIPSFQVEKRYLRKDGAVVWVEITTAVKRGREGEPLHDVSVIADISARRQAEEALRASEARFRSLTALSSDWYWEQDAELRFTKFEGNGPGADEYNPQAQLIGRRPWEIPGVLTATSSWDDLREIMLARREPFRDFEYSYRDRAGRQYYVSVNGEPVIGPDGVFAGYRGTSRDVTERRRRELELARFQAAMDASPDMIYLTDRASMRFVYANEAACRLTGFSREDFLALGPANLLRQDPADIEAMFDRVIAAGAQGTVEEIKSTTKSGLRTMVEVRRRAVHLDGRWLIVTHAQDISARKRAEQATVRLGRMFAALSATNEAILRAKSPQELYLRVCEAAVDGGKFLTTAVLEPEADGSHVRILAASGPEGDALKTARISLDGTTAEGRGLAGTAFRAGAPCVSNDFTADDRMIPWHERARNAGIRSGAAIPLLRAGRATGVILFYSREKHTFDGDIVRLLERMAENIVFALENFAREAERRQAEERVRYLASHDSLTGLPNRAMFGQLLNHAIDSGQRYQRSFAVLFIDLDRFKMINDTLGHHAGDELLQTLAGRLRKAVRASDVVARLGGDEFVVLVQEVRSLKQVATVARKILSAVIRPLKLAGQELRVTTSVGVSMFPEHADNAGDLMRCADLAMYLAKEEGKNNFQIYSTGIRSASLERMALEANLRRALEKGELSLHYQAKQDLQSGEITGVEALLRWNSAQLGPVSPAQFIPVAEETGIIVPIGRWVLQAACAQHVAWLREGLPPVPMAVNLSPRQFAASDLLDDIDGALASTGMQAGFLELEITEGMVMQHPEQAIALLRQIKGRGIRLAIDDFGTGYSSLAQLKRFPIDTLKVDRSFIRDLPQDLEDKAITEAIIAMAKSLSLTVVAEGVETAEQRAFLRDRLCDQMQGYYFSRPLPAAECAALLREVAQRSAAA